MFRQLRNRFILINLLSTSLILIVAFTTIYFIAKNSFSSRQPVPPEFHFETTEFSGSDFSAQETTYVRNFIKERVEEDRQSSLRSLLSALIFTGLAVELVVVLFSYYFAEEAIKPVKETYDAHKIFIANASHEIKTPIAAIKANLEAADLSDSNHWIKNIEFEADKIEKMNLDLLRLARTDAIKEAIVTEPVNLTELINSLLSSFASRIAQKHLSIKFKNTLNHPGKLYKLNQKDLKEISEILLDNAIKYSKSKIRLTLTQKSLTIKNDGATIPPDQLPHVFDRFYQVDKSAPGSGLGLAIAKSLADRNRWSLRVASTKSTTSFTIVFA